MLQATHSWLLEEPTAAGKYWEVKPDMQHAEFNLTDIITVPCTAIYNTGQLKNVLGE